MFKNLRNKLAKLIQPKEKTTEVVVESGPKIITKTKDNPKEGTLRIMQDRKKADIWALEVFTDGKWKSAGFKTDNHDVMVAWYQFFPEKIGELLPH